MEQPRRSKRTNPVVLLILLVVAAAVTLLGNIDVQLKETELAVGGSAIPGLGSSNTVAYDSITAVDYYENFTAGRRTFGTGNMRIKSGLFKNDALGEYDCYLWNSCPAAVVVTYRDAKDRQKYVAFNAASVEETKALCGQLQAHLA